MVGMAFRDGFTMLRQDTLLFVLAIAFLLLLNELVSIAEL
jgi:hypothetical protein